MIVCNIWKSLQYFFIMYFHFQCPLYELQEMKLFLFNKEIFIKQ